MLDALRRLFAARQPDDPAPVPSDGGGGAALVLTGGGARAAYQAGVLRGLARVAPAFRPEILTGVSAGGLNAAFLATLAARHPPAEAAERLVGMWQALRADDVYRLDRPSVAGAMARLVRRGGVPAPPAEGGFLDTSPLHAFAERHLGPLGQPVGAIGQALEAGALRALALTATCYASGESVTWVEGADADPWDRPMRRAVATRIRPEHVLASAALPFFFPAVRVADDEPGTGPGGDGAAPAGWYGDGGIRLTAPLAPALHLGADRILAVNTRSEVPAAAARPPEAYPPASRVLGVLMNAVFLDVLDRDAQTLRRINALLEALPPAQHGGFRPVGLLVLRPSVDLARLASGFEPQLPPSMRLALGGGRSGDTPSPDWLSMLLFDRDYLDRLISLGEADVEARAGEIADFLGAAAAAPGA